MTEEKIDQLENELNAINPDSNERVKLPLDYRCSLRIHNGQRNDASDSDEDDEEEDLEQDDDETFVPA